MTTLIDFENTIEYNVGSKSDIIIISKDYVIKIPRIFLSYLSNFEFKKYHEMLKQEYKIAKKMYKNEIRFIPKPQKLLLLDRSQISNIEITTNKKIPSFTMERLYGINGDYTEGQLRKKLESKLEDQIKVCIEKRFVPNNTSLINTIYNQKKDILYMMDFEFWEQV